MGLNVAIFIIPFSFIIYTTQCSDVKKTMNKAVDKLAKEVVEIEEIYRVKVLHPITGEVVVDKCMKKAYCDRGSCEWHDSRYSRTDGDGTTNFPTIIEVDHKCQKKN